MVNSLPPGFTALPTYAAGQTIYDASNVAVLGSRGIQAWRHDASGVRFILFAAPGPLVSATIVVGTEPISNAGHPHTLEHIIFLGSHNHPDRGYLDNLACRCLAEGTNAWTDNEYTAYTTKTVGFEGFRHLLPCFLDHVIRPRINAASFASEVYHIRADGKEAGVVFCEMQARENTESDLSDRAIFEALFEGTPLSLESGGLCKDIRTLSNEDIMRFHCDQYCGANITVIVGGNGIQPADLLRCVRPLLDDISSQPGYNYGQPRWQTPLKLRRLPATSRKIVHFPCPDEDIGTLILAWRGPGVTDRHTVLAIDVLLRYLVFDVWSPLRQHFVEIEDQLASEIYSSLSTFLETSAISISFSGVEHLDVENEDDRSNQNDHVDENGGTIDEDFNVDSAEIMQEDNESFLLSGDLEEQVMQCLRDIVQNNELPGGIAAIHNAITKEMENQITELESGSHEAVPHHLIEEVVYGHRKALVIGEEVRGFVEAYKALKVRDEQFWISILRDTFVDAPRVEIIMVPDAKLAEELAQMEDRAVTERVERLGADTLAKIGDDNMKRISSLEAQQFAADVFPPLPNTMNISRWLYTVSRDSYPEYNAQSVAIDTDFVHCTMFFDTSSLPLEQRVFLPVLSELIPSCDILLKGGAYVPYTDNARAISEATVSTEKSGVFIGYNDVASQCVVVHFAAMPGSFAEAANVMLQTFFQSEITAERLSAVSQTLQASATSDMRDGEAVLGSSMVLVPFLEARKEWRGDIPNFVLSNFLGSYGLISFLSEEFTRKKPRKQLQRKVIRKMHKALNALRNLSSDNIFVQVAAKDPGQAHETLLQAWSAKRDLFAANVAMVSQKSMKQRKIGQLPLSRRVSGTLGELIGERSVGKIIGIAGVESCSLDLRVDSPVCVGHADWSALTVLTELLCRMEGPLCNAVRGAGLAYGVQIVNSGFMGHLAGMIYESASPAAAWDAICKCLEDFRQALDQDPKESGLGVDLETAKASTLYSLNRGRSTPESVAAGAISRTALGAPASPMADQALEEMVERVTLRGLAEVFDRHVARLGREEGRLVVVTCGAGMVQEIIESFRHCRRVIRLEEVGIEELCPKQVEKVVKGLQKV